MINLRYHIVSIAAVFLALALGAIVGTNAINPVVVNNYKRLNIERQKAVVALSAESRTQQGALDVWEKFGSTLMPQLTRDALKGLSVVLIEHEGTPDELVADVEDAMTAAGAVDAGRVILSKRWRLADEAARTQLARDAGSSAQDVPTILDAAAAQLGHRLSGGADPSREGDLLDVLQRDGFVSLRGVEAGLFPPKGAAVVILWSGAQEAFPDPARFGVPLVRAIAPSTPVAVAEPFESRQSLVGLIRRDGALVKRVGGVDHVDLIPGQLSLVAALRDVEAGLPAPQYGTARGATAVVPPFAT